VASSTPVLTVAVLAALLASGCFAEGDTSTSGLIGTEWRVSSIGGAATIAGAPPTMAFGADGDVRGTTGCNTYSATFLIDREHLHIGPLASTAIGCDAARAAQEAAFEAALAGATTWRQADDASLHMTGGAELVAVPPAADGPSSGPPASAAVASGSGPAGSAGATGAITDLGGTTWLLVELGTITELALVVPDIGFAEDGTVSGFAGCNTFAGSYTVTGSALRLGPLATTKIGCPRPASAVEADVLAGLAGVRAWSVGADGRLVLDGSTRLTFRPG
jgi:heat shock protein HslJ